MSEEADQATSAPRSTKKTKAMRQVTDDMVRTILKYGGLNYDGFLVSMKRGKFPDERQNLPTTLNAISRDGLITLSQEVQSISHGQVKLAIERILQDINSSTHLPESAYKNGIRLNTEYRCQNQKCNPAGKRHLLFISAGPMMQAMQVKCDECGLLNTFWRNRIDFDEYGALQMKS